MPARTPSTPTFGTGGPLSKSESVYRELRSRIISGRYNAGYRLVLDQLAREMGVSAVPVREAIRRLEAERLVTFTRNVGAEVAATLYGRRCVVGCVSREELDLLRVAKRIAIAEDGVVTVTP